MSTSKNPTPKWTLLAYFAGDNNLSNVIERDVEEIEAGSKFPVDIVVHLDMQGKATRVIEFTDGKKTIKANRKNLNTGDPAVLTTFLQEGQARFPLSKYVVMITNHGFGLFNFANEELPDTPIANRADAKFLGATRFSLFETTARRSLETYRRMASIVRPDSAITFEAAIAFDDTARDLLEGTELQSGLRDALAAGDRYAIIGCDACFMSMVEVVYDLRDLGEVFIGSQELEEPAGWPYTKVLQRLSETSDVEEASREIVNAFIDGTPEFPDSILSAIRLANVDALVTALNRLGELLVPLLATNLIGIARAKAATKFFKVYDYIDLRHFAENLAIHLAGNTGVVRAAQTVIHAVDAAILKNGTKPTARNANGLSTYLPDASVNREYSKVLMSLAAPKWHDFVTGYGILRPTLT